jgi:hypothetical protein
MKKGSGKTEKWVGNNIKTNLGKVICEGVD